MLCHVDDFICQEHVTRVAFPSGISLIDSLGCDPAAMSHPWHVLQPIPAGRAVGPCPLLLAHPTRSGLGGSPAGPSNTLQSTRRSCQIPRISVPHPVSQLSVPFFTSLSFAVSSDTITSTPHLSPRGHSSGCSTAGVPAFGAGVAGQGPRRLLLICLHRAGQKKGCQNPRNNKNTHRQSHGWDILFQSNDRKWR